MTPAQRQQRRREKLRAKVSPDQIAAEVVTLLDRVKPYDPGAAKMLGKLATEIKKRQRACRESAADRARAMRKVINRIGFGR
jgi:hypothetical protein